MVSSFCRREDICAITSNRRNSSPAGTAAAKTKDFTKHVEFADLISREGILIG